MEPTHRFFRSGHDSSSLLKSPFRFFGPKSVDDERLALMERFRLEGLDARKLSDAQMLPFVWQWLADAEINCKSLRHQIEKMRRQQDEELQEVGDYVEQVWKLSTEKLILLEAENKSLKEHHSRNTGNANEADDEGDDADDDEEDSETESKNYRHSKLVHNNNNNNNNNIPRPMMSNSISTSSLSSTVGGEVQNILCDNLSIMKTSHSLHDLMNRLAVTNDNEIVHKSSRTPTTTVTSGVKENFCEKCELLDTELVECRAKVAELDSTIEVLSEKHFVLDKLNRSIELENENFAYKLAEAESRADELERKKRVLEKEHARLTAAAQLNDRNSRILLDELNHKIKQLEEDLDLRLQLNEELELKYQRQKERHQETLWKLRNFVHEKEFTNGLDKTGLIVDVSPTLNDSDSGHKSSESGYSHHYHNPHRSIDKLV